MGRHLMTQSLLSSWLYLYRAYEGYEAAAYADFLDTLNRVEKPSNEAMRAGIELEDAINAVLSGKLEPSKTSESVRYIAEIVRGGQPQVALYKDKYISGMNFLLYGRLDYLKAGTIYDVKFSGKYEVGKYLSSVQHPFYFELCPEAVWFEYLISDGRDVFSERYTRAETEPVDKTIRYFIEFLKARGLLDIYFEKWKAND